jgi:hypothetical protein
VGPIVGFQPHTGFLGLLRTKGRQPQGAPLRILWAAHTHCTEPTGIKDPTLISKDQWSNEVSYAPMD